MIGSTVEYALVNGSNYSLKVSVNDDIYKNIELTEDEFGTIFRGMFSTLKDIRANKQEGICYGE